MQFFFCALKSVRTIFQLHPIRTVLLYFLRPTTTTRGCAKGGRSTLARLCRAVQPMPLGVMHLPTQTAINALGAPMRRPEGASLARFNLPPANRPTWSIAAWQRFQTRPGTRAHIRVPLPAAAAAIRSPPAMALPFASYFCIAPCIASSKRRCLISRRPC